MTTVPLQSPKGLTYQSQLQGRVVGYTGKVGPGKLSCLLGLISAALHLVLYAVWLLVPVHVKVMMTILVGIPVALLFVALLPLTIFALTRGVTALVLHIETTPATAGVALSVLALAAWVFPIARFMS